MLSRDTTRFGDWSSLIDARAGCGTLRSRVRTLKPINRWLLVTGVAAFSVSMSLTMSGCAVRSGLNTPCNLVTKPPDGGAPILLTERQVQDILATSSDSTRDFVSFGSTDCDDLVCVRDVNFPKGTALDEPAFGYCSRPCALGVACPSDDVSLDDRPSTRLSCRSLVLSKEVLSNLNLGVDEPYFCARPLDGGTAN